MLTTKILKQSHECTLIENQTKKIYYFITIVDRIATAMPQVYSYSCQLVLHFPALLAPVPLCEILDRDLWPNGSIKRYNGHHANPFPCRPPRILCRCMANIDVGISPFPVFTKASSTSRSSTHSLPPQLSSHT